MKGSVNLTRRAVAGVVMLALATGAAAAEFIVESEVRSVEPVMTTRTVTEEVGDCSPRRPSARELVALLAWDLRADCREVRREEQVVAGYRVFYQWDDELRSRVLDERPGETLRLRVRLD